tara:strand:+ start:12 stop:800 length:789 start_codon:yes stop_codon:yes gene_type:complete
MATLFYEMPVPNSPSGVKEFIARQEDDAAFISALAEAARGQVAGARTATEMAIIDAQLRTRLATREGHLNDALEDVAKKVFYLCKKYMRQTRLVRIAGNSRWSELSHKDLIDIDVDFKMVGHNPIRRNPGMMAETMIQMLPFLSQNQNVDVRRLTEEILANLGLPSRILIPEAELLAQQQAIAAQQQQAILAEQQAKLGGAAAGRPALEAQEQARLQQVLESLPPEEAEQIVLDMANQQAAEEANQAPEEALPGGGGAPIRE